MEDFWKKKLIEENFPSVKNVLIVTGKHHLKSNEYFNNSINKLNSLNIEFYDKIDPYPSPETVNLLSHTIKKNKLLCLVSNKIKNAIRINIGSIKRNILTLRLKVMINSIKARNLDLILFFIDYTNVKYNYVKTQFNNIAIRNFFMDSV